MANVVVTDDAYADLRTTLQSLSRRALPVHVVDSGTLVEGWASVLAVGAASGGTSPLISVGDHLDFDSLGALPATGDMRVGDTWSLVGWDSGSIVAAPLITWDGTSPNLTVGNSATLILDGSPTVSIRIGGTSRVTVTAAGTTLGANALNWGASLSPIISQNGTAGGTFILRAQDGVATGGTLQLEGGGATGGGSVVLRAGARTSGGYGQIRLETEGALPMLTADANAGIAFFAGAPAVSPAVAGSRGGNAALASLLTTLASMGLITDTTTP